MKWSLKKKPVADEILPPAQGKGIFRRAGKNAQSTADVETVEVVTVWPADYPPAAAEFDGADAMSRVEPKLEEATARSPDAPSEVELLTPDALASAEPETKAKKPMWAKAPKKEKEPKPAKIAKNKADKAQASVGPRPLKVLIGYLPDSSERDTYYYMLGVAEKNLDSENIGFAGLTKFETGYAYEIHEGGSGRGFLESILTQFKNLPAFSAEESHHAFIRTATRTVRVERTAAGIYSVILPESDTTPQSDWVVTGKKLAPLVEKRTGLFVAGVVIFLSSIVALMGGYATRYQPYTATMVNIERVPVAKLPYSQWNNLTNLSPGDYVMALKYDRGEWLVQTPSNPSGRAGGAPKPGVPRSQRRPMPTPPGPAAAPTAESVTTSATAAVPVAPSRADAPSRPTKQRH